MTAPGGAIVEITGTGDGHEKPTAADTFPCPSCHGPMDIALGRMGLSLHPTCDPRPASAASVVSEVLALVTDADANSDRSRQTVIGPSEIGHPCDRWVALKLGGVPAVNPRATSWAAIIGTAGHAHIADVLARAEIRRFADGVVSTRLRVEERVTVGDVDGVPVTGSCDLYDAHTGTAVDWKIVSTARAVALGKEPPAQYRVQAHLYGRGYANRGLPVRTVALCFIRRDGGEPVVWSEPYDETVAVAALARVSAIAKSVRLLGVDATAPALPVTANYCHTCPFYEKGTTNPRACAGVPQATGDIAGLLK